MTPYIEQEKTERRRDRIIRLLASPAALFIAIGAAIIVSAIVRAS